MKILRRILLVLLPLAVLGAGAYASLMLIESYQAPQKRPPEVPPPLVEVIEVQAETITLTVKAEGVVEPRTVTELVPEISGRVVRVSPALVAGGFFEEGEELLKIDGRDYELALTRAAAAVAQAELRVAIEQEEAEVAVKEWNDLEEGEPPPLVRREPQVKEAMAALASAQAELEQAQFDLERTLVYAPFAGRVRDERVDVGQFVQRGGSVATLYSVDVAEIRLPIADEQLAYIDLPLVYRKRSGETERRGRGPAVIVRVDFAGKTFEWSGRIVRTDGEIDRATRMIHAIAQVQDPYAPARDPRKPPLAVGMFVQAEIQGRTVRGVIPIPRSVLHGENTVLVVDSDNRLEFREVDILRRERDRVLVRSGLKSGDRICVSALEAAVNGMEVRVD